MIAEVLLNALEQVPQPFLLLDSAGRVALGNDAFAKLTGTSWEKFRGVELHAIAPLRFSSHDFKNEKPLEQASWRGHAVWELGDGMTKRMSVDIRSLRPGTGGKAHGYLVLFSSPAAMTQQGGKKERLESLGRLAGGIAHDLNNILTGILGHMAFLSWALPETGDHRDSLKSVEEGARRAGSLVNQILEFAKGEQSKLRTVNFTQLVDSSAALFRAALPANVRVEIANHEAPSSVLGDEGQLSQLIMNLVVNARDALSGGGLVRIGLNRVVVSSEDDYRESPKMLVVPAPEEIIPGHYVRLLVQDNGAGIPREVQSRIFQPFFTTKARKGTGLGLSNVSAIIHMHHGFLTLESEPGKGSRFAIYLPEFIEEAVPAAKSETKSGAAQQAALPKGRERILVVEDEDSVRTVMQRCLEHLGYDVTVAASGDLGLDVFTQNSGDFHLVILDMMMPGMAGDEVFVRLREIDPKVRVLISSGYSTDGRANAVVEAGGMGFIAKPFAIETLAKEVRRCLDS